MEFSVGTGGPGTLIQTYTTVTHQGGALALLHVTDACAICW
jgi:hypothetical protein